MVSNSPLSPLDGRYQHLVEDLAKIFSESGLVKNRVQVEIEYLLALSEQLDKKSLRITGNGKKQLKKIFEKFSDADFKAVKQIEGRINHDVKAVEYFLAEKLKNLKLGKMVQWIHFGITSEDINNIANSLQLREGNKEIVRIGKKLQTEIVSLIDEGKGALMMGKTHGQPAVPTTMGKELLVYANQIQDLLEEIVNFEYRGKMTGAVGTLAAHKISFPEVDWLKFSQKFVSGFGLGPEMVTTQVLPGGSWVKLFSILHRLSLVVESVSKNLWWYVSTGYFQQKQKESEVGSSTMPQKVNPIALENAEGNAGLAGSMFSFFVSKFSHTRLQRDLSDSTVRRNFGTAFGYLYLSLSSLGNGLARLDLAKEVMREEVSKEKSLIAEGVQVILRKEGEGQAYEKAKKFFRGRTFDKREYQKWVSNLGIKSQVKQVLLELSADNYLGFAEEIVVKESRKLKKRVEKLD